MTRQKIQIVETKTVKFIALRSGSKNAGGKNEGNLHYVIENKWCKNVRLWPFHYIVENTPVIGVFPLY
jgi:hypothetical protein